MCNRGLVAVALATLMLAETLPAPAAPTPLAGLRDLVGAWKCTYRAGSTSLPYHARYAYDGDAQVFREDVALPGGGGDEELLAYDAAHRLWRVVVFDGHGSAYVMRGPGSDPRHFAYRSVYPDTSIAVRFDRVSAAKYTLRGTVRIGGKTISSVDTCLR